MHEFQAAKIYKGPMLRLGNRIIFIFYDGMKYSFVVSGFRTSVSRLSTRSQSPAPDL